MSPPLASTSSIFGLQLALDLDSAEFISWACFNAMILVFIVLFLWTLCIGRYEGYRHDHAIFQRLRLLSFLMCLLDFCWPFQFYFDFQLLPRIIFLCLGSLTDLLTAIIILILSHRVFVAYYHTKRYQSPKVVDADVIRLPLWIYVMMMLYAAGMTLIVVVEIIAFSNPEWSQFRRVWMISSAIFYAINAVFAFTLISFMMAITVLVWHIKPADTESLVHAHDTGVAHCSAEEQKRLYYRMIALCTGFALYYMNWIAAFSVLFATEDFDLVSKPGWIIDHEIVGHFILYITFWSYLRVRHHDHTLEHEQASHGHVNDAPFEIMDSPHDLIYDDRLDHSAARQQVENKANIMDVSYENIYRDLGKLAHGAVHSNQKHNMYKQPKSGATRSTDTFTSSELIDSSLSSSDREAD